MGSSVGALLDGSKRLAPAIGMGATVVKFSEREAATIVEVREFGSGPRKGQPREITVQYDHWMLTSGSEQAGTAKYLYTPDPGGRRSSFTLGLKGRNAGRWVEKGSGGRGWTLVVGHRERLCNPHI